MKSDSMASTGTIPINLGENQRFIGARRVGDYAESGICRSSFARRLFPNFRRENFFPASGVISCRPILATA
jgi:hypothetical protein